LAGVSEEADAVAEQDGREVNDDLVQEPFVEALVGDVGDEKCVGGTTLPCASAKESVRTIRSGTTISRNTPLLQTSRPSGDRMQWCMTPPGRRSILQ